MKTAISIPDPIFKAAEAAAERLEISRSEFYTKAIEKLLLEQSDEAITAQLNEIYASHSSKVDPVLYAMTLRSIGKETW